MWKFLKRWGYHTTLPVSWENCVSRSNRTLHGTADWFKIGKGVKWGYILSRCLFNWYAGYIMLNTWLDESQDGIKIARRNSNNRRNADETTLMAESEEELKSILIRVKEENEKTGLKLNIQRSWHPWSPNTSRQIDGEKVETVKDFIFLASKITADGDCSHEIKRHLLIGKKAMANLDSILKSNDVTLLTKVCVVKAMVFPVVMYKRVNWTIKKTQRCKIDGFELLCWRRLLRIPWTAKKSS